jgi:hypothetical protein
MIVGFLHVHTEKEIRSMSTHVLLPEEDVIVVETPRSKTSKKEAKKKAKKARMKRAAYKARLQGKKAWKAFRRMLRKARAKAVVVARWAKSKAKAGWTRTVEFSRISWDWIKVAAARSWYWSKGAAGSTWTWSKDITVGAGAYIAQVARWFTTPARWVLSGIAGYLAALTFGPIAVLGVALFVLAYLLFSNKPKAKKHRKRSKRRKIVTIEDLNSTIIAEDENTRLLTDRQTIALQTRIDELVKDGEMWADKENKNMVSEVAGRLYLAIHRLNGSTETVNALAKRHKEREQEVSGVDKAGEDYTWTAVKRGMSKEDQLITKLLAEADPIVVTAEPTPVS